MTQELTFRGRLMVAWRYASKKVKKYGDFCAHAFVKYVNNLYPLKILRLKSTTTTQYLSIFTNIRKIFINENLCKAILTTEKRKVTYQKYLAFTKTMNCSKCHMTKAARNQMPPKEPYLDRANRQVVSQNGQNEGIFEVSQVVQSGQNDQN